MCLALDGVVGSVVGDGVCSAKDYGAVASTGREEDVFVVFSEEFEVVAADVAPG